MSDDGWKHYYGAAELLARATAQMAATRNDLITQDALGCFQMAAQLSNVLDCVLAEFERLKNLAFSTSCAAPRPWSIPRSAGGTATAKLTANALTPPP